MRACARAYPFGVIGAHGLLRQILLPHGRQRLLELIGRVIRADLLDLFVPELVPRFASIDAFGELCPALYVDWDGCGLGLRLRHLLRRQHLGSYPTESKGSSWHLAMRGAPCDSGGCVLPRAMLKKL